MATEEWIKRAIAAGKSYEELPSRIRAVLPQAEWKTKVKYHCFQRGVAWADSMAMACSGEQEYYEDLVSFFREHYRLFPYHLADYVCRVLRTTPFRYYSDMLVAVMKDEKPYDQIPNFTAADIVRCVGVGRNEFITAMNRCRARKLLWKMSKAVVREQLPAEPLPQEPQPWWIVHVVNLGEAEFRALSGEELALCTQAAQSRGARARDLHAATLQALLRRGLLYLDVPIRPDDHVSIPPLEGFVSNRDSTSGTAGGDPTEVVLYAVFVATSARASVADLATILQVDLPTLQAAVSIACRLGFATRLPNSHVDEDAETSPVAAALDAALDLGSDGELGALTEPGTASPAALDPMAAGAEGSGQAVALVVDAEVTSYLMMGALSPGLKRHSVTLFEGGRLTGSDMITELIAELDASGEAAAGFEGEMQRLAGYSRAMAAALRCVRAAGGGRPVELLRKESLAGLAPAAAARVLSHAYAAVVPITPLPYPPLPLAPSCAGPTNFGATAEASTPWAQLALYWAMRSGPASLVLVAGQQLWRLPQPLATASHAFVWPWDLDAVRAHSAPVVVEAMFLLFTLNEHLSRTALLVQPLHLPPGTDPTALPGLDVPLPLPRFAAEPFQDPSSTKSMSGVDPISGQSMSVDAGELPLALDAAVRELGLDRALGHVRLVQVPAQDAGRCSTMSALPVNGKILPLSALASHVTTKSEGDGRPAADGKGGVMKDEERQKSHNSASVRGLPADVPVSQAGLSERQSGVWVPLQLKLGLPLSPNALCSAVCSAASSAGFLDAEAREAHTKGQATFQRKLSALVAAYGACTQIGGGDDRVDGAEQSVVDLPICNLLCKGSSIERLECMDYVQGVGALCLD